MAQLPNLQTKESLEIEEELGKFQYDDTINYENDLIEVGPMQLGNGAVYIGTVTKKDNLREGRGVQIWKDGSKYEGHWFQDCAKGPGRLIHDTGAFY